MKTPRLVSLCFGILTLATLLHAEPPASTSKEDDLKEKMNALQQAVDALQGEATLRTEGYPFATAKIEMLEKELARILKLSPEEIHTMIEKSLQSDDPLVQAQALLGQGKLTKADQSYDNVISAKDGDPKRLRLAHDGKATVAFAKSDFPTAHEHYLIALKLCDKDKEPLIWAKSAVKVTYMNSVFGEAEPLLQEVLRLREEKLGLDHPDVGDALRRLGIYLLAFKRLSDVETKLRRSLAIYEASYGKNHPIIANVLDNLVRLLLESDRLGEVEPLMVRSLGIIETCYGKDHGISINARRELENFQQKQKK